MSNRKFNIAVVGLGFGAEFIPIWQKHPHTDCVAICQRNADKLKACGDQAVTPAAGKSQKTSRPFFVRRFLLTLFAMGVVSSSAVAPGVLWIGLNKPGIGVHGTNNPQTIGRAQSHGCMRTANWDVVRLAKMITKGMTVIIE